MVSGLNLYRDLTCVRIKFQGISSVPYDMAGSDPSILPVKTSPSDVVNKTCNFQLYSELTMT